jgi:hypothetical protein
MKFELVDDWKNVHKWVSTQCMSLAAAIQGTWLYIPEDMRQAIPSKLVTGVTIGLMVLGVVGRVVKQGKNDVPVS